MLMQANILSREELELLSDPSFYRIKKNAAEKVMRLLGDCSEQIKGKLGSFATFPDTEVLVSHPKISRGENYLFFPWTILDYPRYFNGPDVFTIRTLCWWGNGLSITLHLSGKYATKYHEALNIHQADFSAKDFLLCINKDQWQHHYGSENYQFFKNFEEADGVISKYYRAHHFIKIMKQFPFSAWNNFPVLAGETVVHFLNALSPSNGHEIVQQSKTSQ